MNEIATPEKEVSHALEVARSWNITDDEQFSLVDSHCAGLLKLKKKVEADFKDSKEKTYGAWKAVVAQEKGHLDGIDEARRIDKQKMDAYLTAKEAERKAEEARLAAIAKKQAEDDAIARAQAMESAGQNEEAAAIIDAPVYVAPIVIPKTAPKATTVIRKVWKYRVKDEAKVPREFLTLDDKKIGGVVRSMGAATNIPGIEAFQESC